MSDAALIRIHVRFCGRVQGVGFRWTARQLAQELGLTGWIKNEWDGSVEAEIQGSSEEVAAFFPALAAAYRRFPMEFRVDSKASMVPVTGEKTFSVRF